MHRSPGAVLSSPSGAGAQLSDARDRSLTRAPGPSFNRDAVWRTFSGDPALVSEFLSLLLREIPQWVQTVTASVNAGDLTAIDQSVNQMRGALAQAEASTVMEIVNTIEHRTRAGYLDAIPALAAALTASTGTLLSDLEAWAHALRETTTGEPAPGPAHVLVCDDDRSTRFIVSAIVRRTLRCRITECDNGHEALRLAAAGDVDVMVLDIGLPLVDGVQVLETIRRSPRTAHLPVIVLSSERRAEIVGRLLELGVSGYELKPPSADRLMEALEVATAGRGGANPTGQSWSHA